MLYEFTKLRLEKCEFDNLVFMHEPSWWLCDRTQHEFLLKICCKPLTYVVERVIEESGSTDPIRVFENLQHITAKDKNGDLEKGPWFADHLRISQNFDKGLMGRLWIRNLNKSERNKCPTGSFYVEDGNHRMLVYALHLKFREDVTYEPVEVLHATSWDIVSGVLGHKALGVEGLDGNEKLRYDDSRYYIHSEDDEKFDLPIDIQININERRVL